MFKTDHNKGIQGATTGKNRIGKIFGHITK